MRELLAKSLDGTSWKAGKISEMVLEFAQPLLELEGGPPDITALRHLMQLVMICWNLPVQPSAVRTREMFDRVVPQMPPHLRQVVLQLMEDRKTKFAAIPLTVLLRVEGKDLKHARLVAEAHMPAAERPAN